MWVLETGFCMHIIFLPMCRPETGCKTSVGFQSPNSEKDWGYQWSDYPNAEMYANREVSLPIYVGLRDEEVRYVIEVINGY